MLLVQADILHHSVLLLLIVIIIDINIFLHHLLVLLCIGVFNVDSRLISLLVANDIDISAVDILEGSAIGVDSDAHSSVDTSDFNTVTWANLINEVFICAQVDGLWGFTLWH